MLRLLACCSLLHVGRLLSTAMFSTSMLSALMLFTAKASGTWLNKALASVLAFWLRS